MNVKRRLSILVLISILFMITSSMFVNCSSKKFVSQSALDISDALQYNLSGGVEVLKFSDLPQSITDEVNDVVRYGIVPERMDVVEFVEYKLNSENWKPSYDSEIVLTGLNNGAQKISIRATSKTGSQSDEINYMWLVDSVSPVITFNSKPAVQIIESTAQVIFSFSEAVGSISCRLNNIVINNCSSPLTLNNLVTGTNYQFLLQATDLVGNSSGESFQFSVVDDGLASINFVTRPNSYSNVVNPTFTFGEVGGANTLVRFRCKLDTGVAADCASGVQTGSLQPGEHRFEVVGYTSANVQSRIATYIWTLDTAAPSVSIQSGVFERYIPTVLENNSDLSADASNYKTLARPGILSVPNSDSVGISQVLCQLIRYKTAIKNCSAEATPAEQSLCFANPYHFNGFDLVHEYTNCRSGYLIPSDSGGGVFRLKAKAIDLAGNQKITAAEFRIAESGVPLLSVHLSGGGALPGNFIVRDINNNYLDQPSTGTNTPYATYGFWAINSSLNPFFINSMGIDWSVTSGILAGINSVLQESDKSKVKIFAIANLSLADSNANKFNISGTIEQYNVRGAYRQAIYNSENPGGAAFISDPSSVLVTQSLTDLQIALPNEPTSAYDIRSNVALASVWGVSATTYSNDSKLAQSGLVQSVLKGFFASGSFRLGGYDLEGQSLAAATERDRTAGELLGRVIKTALLQDKKIFINLTADGSTRGSASGWHSDTGHGIQVFMVVDPNQFSDFTFGNYMIGGFDSGTGLVNEQSVGRQDAERAAAIMTCNYLAFAKKQNCSLNEIGHVLTSEQLLKAKTIFPIVIN